MKKRIIRITIFLFTFLIVIGVKAATTYTVASVKENVNTYNNSIKEYDALNCDGTLTSQTTVDKCNDLELKRSKALAHLFNAQANNPDLIDSTAKAIIEENNDECSGIFSSDIQELFNRVLLLFYIAGPILLLLFGSLDFTKAIFAGDEKKRKALYIKFIRRAIALALLFATPVLVKILVSTFGADKYTKHEYTCNYTEKQLTITYTPSKKASANGGSSYGGNYGVTSSSVLVNLNGTSDRDAGKYVVVGTTYPGGITGFQEMITANGICQTSTGSNGKCVSSSKSPNGWGDCCAGFAQVQACGLKKGLTLTHASASMSKCNSAGGSLGCGGVWDWGQDHCFETEAEYVNYVIGYIQQGTPVLTCTGTSSRHFLTLVGFKEGTNGTSHEDLLLLDSWDGRLETFKKRKLAKKGQTSGHPCNGKNGYYWAAPVR